MNYRMTGEEIRVLKSLFRLTYADIATIIGKNKTWMSYVDRHNQQLSVSDTNKLLNHLGVTEAAYITIRSFLYDIKYQLKQ
jgi:hypothetical protein